MRPPPWITAPATQTTLIAVVMAVIGAIGGVNFTEVDRRTSSDSAATRRAIATGAQDLPVVKPTMDCVALTGREIPAPPGEIATIGSAQILPATATAPSVCEVVGLIAPQHQFRVRMPVQTWTQRYLQLGCGGFCGNADPRQPVPAVSAGCPRLEAGEFVVAYGNQGHVSVGGDASWATDPALMKDFAYEAEHQLSVVAKNLTRMYYGQRPKHSYFSGCSGGGRQALNLTQRFPDDFDGVLAGAPANIWVAMFVFSFAWSARANLGPDGRDILTANDLPVLHKGALEACDDTDGLADGLITDPRACSFDPGDLRCGEGRTTGCLTPAKIEAARKIYHGAVDENGVPFYPGYPNGGQAPGSELAWQRWIVHDHPDVPTSNERLANGHLKYLAALNQTRSYDWRTIPFTRETFNEVSAMAPVMDATDPDLREFRDAGGKLIIWHGWNDTPIVPQGSIAYYEAMQRFTGADTPEFARLYLVPGMYHCGGGDGPNRMDLLTPLTEWVERGSAPERIVATQQDNAGDVVRTRPIYPYPKVPAYDGSGDPDNADSFHPVDGASYPPARWVGEFRANYQHWCQVKGGRLMCGPDRQRD